MLKLSAMTFSAMTFALLSTSALAQSADIYLDPAKGQTLQKFARGPVPAGTLRVHLLPGYHGTPVFYGKTSPHDIQILGTLGATRTESDTSIVDRTFFDTGAYNLDFHHITWRARVKMPVLRFPNAMFALNPGAHDIRVESSSFAITDNTSNWTPADYAITDGNVQNLVASYGKNLVVSHSEFKNCLNLFTSNGDGLKFLNNDLHDFGNDAIEFSGSNLIIAGNRITNAHGGRWSPTALHSDAMQGNPNHWGGVNTNVTIADNIVTPGPGFTGSLQGISAFDGRWKDVVVTGNDVTPRAYHGITWFGVAGIKIDRNIVRQYADPASPPGANNPPPWIDVSSGKDKSPSTDVVIGHNITPRYNGNTISAMRPQPVPAHTLPRSRPL